MGRTGLIPDTRATSEVLCAELPSSPPQPSLISGGPAHPWAIMTPQYLGIW